MLDVARGRDPVLSTVVGSAERLPFAPESFDLVFCVDVVHHLADLSAFFSEAFRVLTPRSALLIATDSEQIIRTRFPLAEYFPETVDADLAR
jgi:ubiquinone/menaquinone biosynthesis C-methylase UbiE